MKETIRSAKECGADTIKINLLRRFYDHRLQ